MGGVDATYHGGRWSPNDREASEPSDDSNPSNAWIESPKDENCLPAQAHGVALYPHAYLPTSSSTTPCAPPAIVTGPEPFVPLTSPDKDDKLHTGAVLRPPTSVSLVLVSDLERTKVLPERNQLCHSPHLSEDAKDSLKTNCSCPSADGNGYGESFTECERMLDREEVASSILHPQRLDPRAARTTHNANSVNAPLGVPLVDFQIDTVLNWPAPLEKEDTADRDTELPSTRKSAVQTVPTAPLGPIPTDQTSGYHQSLHNAAHLPHVHHPTPFDGWNPTTWAQRKVALVTGITGQDGSYLAELLLDKGYIVHGLIRRSSSFNTSRLHHLLSDPRPPGPDGPIFLDPSEGSAFPGERVRRFHLHYGDLIDATNLSGLIARTLPSEVYNLGAQSHVKVSFEMAEYTADVDGVGPLRLLEAIRVCGLTHLTRFYQASTSELYGLVRTTPQNEDTPFYPRSPYGAAKLYAYWITVNYRESYGMFAANGILFNHESPRRGRTFVTRKISRAIAEIALGRQECLYMGNLDARRDWGHARDYVEGMWRMMQHHSPDDFVLATNTSHSVREFIEEAFAIVGIRLRWEGRGLHEVGVDVTDDSSGDGDKGALPSPPSGLHVPSGTIIDEDDPNRSTTPYTLRDHTQQKAHHHPAHTHCVHSRPGRILVRVDARYFRPAEVDSLRGDASKARRILGWEPRVGFRELVREMVEADLQSAKYLVEDKN